MGQQSPKTGHFYYITANFNVMNILSIRESRIKTAALSTSILFLALAILFFSPIKIPHKLAFPVFTLFIAGLWMLPWQMTAAMLCSVLGDYMGTCSNFIGQMGFFAIAHLFIISFFIIRYRRKVEPDGKLTEKAKGYLAVVVLCSVTLLYIAFSKILPGAPAGPERIGASCYAVIISTMLMTGLLQRSSLYALGATLFVFSDFVLAWNRFVEPVPYRNYIVLISYYAAQWLLFIRSTRFRVKNQIRLLRF